MGKGIVQELKKEMDIEDTWISFELHPDTPKGGIKLTDKFPGRNMDDTFNMLRQRGEPLGLEFGKVDILSNTNKAIQASEYARDMGKHTEFHKNMFEAYFKEGLDIGSDEVIDRVAKASGLDTVDMHKKLESGEYKKRLEAIMNEAERYEINSVPTFIINNKYMIQGAQPVEVFKRYLKQIGEE